MIRSVLAAGLFALSLLLSQASVAQAATKPNILFVIMDDVGIDQLKSFGYGGPSPANTPTLDAIAAAGIRFRNTWSMPECSNGRMALFTGRYPLRTNVYQAIGPNDLANSQVSPYEVTAPRLLKPAGYRSGLFGKYHLGGPENNKAGDLAPSSMGWDFFYGWTGGLPGSIDTTAGGVAPKGTYTCGFVPTKESGGADVGACYSKTSSGGTTCMNMSSTGNRDAIGLRCLGRGGILVPNATCATPPSTLNFSVQNGHYVSPLVINNGKKLEVADLSDPRARGFRATIEVDAAIRWIKQTAQTSAPWMATVSFSADHTPLQPPPRFLTPSVPYLPPNCTNTLNVRLISNAMIEAMDSELGRLLVETGLAQKVNGKLIYDPALTNTAIIVVGDNGSLGTTVKPPFDASRAKATAYQTGVWVPLIVSGPMVASPGRKVESMTNATDVYQLFGEIAGIDVRRSVPRPVDSVTLLPYLNNSSQQSLRRFNFTQGGLNIQKNGAHNGPCVLGAAPGICSQTPVSKSVCEDNGGVWWGQGADDPSTYGGGLAECWQVNQTLYKNDPANYASKRVAMSPQVYSAMRNEHYKLVRNANQDYDPGSDAAVEVTSEEFYAINQASPVPIIDTADRNLLAGMLNGRQQDNYKVLSSRLNALLASQASCPGDGNSDSVVDTKDVSGYQQAAQAWGLSSVFDFNHDALTDSQDLQTIQSHLGACPK